MKPTVLLWIIGFLPCVIQAQALDSLYQQLVFWYDSSELDSAVAQYSYFIDTSKKQFFDPGKISMIKGLHEYMYTRSFDQAIKHFTDAELHFKNRPKPNNTDIVLAIKGRAGATYLQHKYEQALSIYQSAYEYFDETVDPRIQARIIGNEGAMLLQLLKNEEALGPYTRALAIYDELEKSGTGKEYCAWYEGLHTFNA